MEEATGRQEKGQPSEDKGLPKCSISKRGNAFQNPFPEFKWLSFTQILRLALWETDNTNLPSTEELDKKLPYSDNAEGNFKQINADNANLVSWIGHSSCLVKISDVFILTDPIFSQNCSAIQFNLGRLTRKIRRFRKPGLQLEDIPCVDAVVISHNHYDHLDYSTVLEINKKFEKAKWFVPLGLKQWFVASGISENRVRELNWWEEAKDVEFSDKKLTFTCLPAQHWTLRNGFDWNHTLWCGWAIKSQEKNVYFAGDTGYNNRIFRQIGEHCGPFDLSLIPIGAYEPRDLLKRQHVNPDEAVTVHQEVRSKFSLGIHWGTFMLGYENYLAPQRDLDTALIAAEISQKDFVTFEHGHTGTF